MIFKLFLLFSTVHTLNSAEVPNGKDVEELGELLATSLIYRHGDRNPTMQYPGDIYNASYWPEGWGQLTSLGKRQQYALGQWSRARYQKLLSTTFNSSDVYVRSSDIDRTLMSAMSNLAGLYPPIGEQVWNNAIQWQPIPVHTVSEKLDYLTAAYVPPCKAFEQAYDAYLQSDEMKTFKTSIQPIFDYLTESLGTPIKSLLTVLFIRDSLFIQSVNNLTLPEWSKSIFPHDEKFYDAALKCYHIFSSTKFLAKFRSGFLLKDILDRFTKKVGKTLQPDLKYNAYSTHDAVLACFLNSLGVYDFKFVPYAAAIILELRNYQNEAYVQLYYKNSEMTPEPINIPQCGTACPLSKMYELYAEILPQNDFPTECNIGV